MNHWCELFGKIWLLECFHFPPFHISRYIWISRYIEVFLVNNLAGTSAGEGGLKRWRPLLMLRANQAVYVCLPYTEQGLTPRRPPICAPHNVHLEPYMDLMHTPFANQLSITYNWRDQCNGTTWVHLLYISIAQYLFHLFYQISEKYLKKIQHLSPRECSYCVAIPQDFFVVF